MPRSFSVLLVSLLLGGVATINGAQSSSYRVLHAFAGSPDDGSEPSAALISDKRGNLFGTTVTGGGEGSGTVFKVTTKGEQTILHSFGGGSDGAQPYGTLFLGARGTLYGTTVIGGESSCTPYGSCGTVFKIKKDGTYSQIYSFKGGSDGQAPLAGVIADASDHLYGTTTYGGTSGCFGYGCGTIYKIGRDDKEARLYKFKGAQDGFRPVGGLVADSSGNLYGTAEEGGQGVCQGYGCGTIFKLAPDGTFTVLYAFQGGTDGGMPESTLILDQSGNLYGTAFEGGNTTNCNSGYGCGVVYEFTAGGREIVLHAFDGGSDGELPQFSGVVEDGSGNLYGATPFGGNGCGKQSPGCGIVYKIAPEGTETVLRNFVHKPAGRNPAAGLLLSKSGKLFGTTSYGGDLGCDVTHHRRHGCGTVFELKP